MLHPTFQRHIFIELSIVNLEAIGISEVCKSTHFGSYFECLFKIVYDEWKIFMGSTTIQECFGGGAPIP